MPSSATKIIIIEETGNLAAPGQPEVIETKQLTLQIAAGTTATEAGYIVARAIAKMERQG